MLSAIAAVMHQWGEGFDRQRVVRWTGIVLAFHNQIAILALFAIRAYGLIIPVERKASTDFVSFYAAGTLVNAGTPELIYDQAAHNAAEQQVAGPDTSYNFFYYPPIFPLLCAVLAYLPYVAAFVLFQAVGLGLYVLSLGRILGERQWSALMPVVAFPAVLWNLALGQTAFVTAALFAGGTLLIDRRPWLAGLLFGAICYKPHFGLLIPLALAAGRRYRAFAVATITVFCLAFLSIVLLGRATWAAFLDALAGAIPVYASSVQLFGYVTPFGAVRVMGGTASLALSIQACAEIALAALVVAIWRRRHSLPVRAAVLCAASLVAAPTAMWYDALLAGVAVAWLYAGGKILAAERVVLLVCGLTFLYPVGIAEIIHLPVAAFAALAVLAVVVLAAAREARQPHQGVTRVPFDPVANPDGAMLW